MKQHHIAEATDAGGSLDVVLGSLGPADALGRAYAVELLLHPQNDRPRHAADRWFRLVGLSWSSAFQPSWLSARLHLSESASSQGGCLLSLSVCWKP